MKYHVFERHPGGQCHLTDLDLAWVAGYIDAEGSMRHHGTVVVTVSNCHLPTLRELCRAFGGSIRHHGAASGNRRPCFQWAVTGPRARALLTSILPYLHEKRPQAALLLEVFPPRTRAYTRAERDRRAAVRGELQRMKRPSFTATDGSDPVPNV